MMFDFNGKAKVCHINKNGVIRFMESALFEILGDIGLSLKISISEKHDTFKISHRPFEISQKSHAFRVFLRDIDIKTDMDLLLYLVEYKHGIGVYKAFVCNEHSLLIVKVY